VADEQQAPGTAQGEQLRELDAAEQRNATLRVLSAWFNLTLVYVMAWPLLVVLFDAPLDPSAELPFGWFVLYLLPLLAVLAIEVRLWRVNRLSTEPLHWRLGLAMFRRGGWQGQVALVLVVLTLVCTVLLFAAAPVNAVQALIGGLARAIALQLLVAGYVKGMLDQLGAHPGRVYWLGVGMFAVTIAGETAVAVAARQNPTLEEVMLAFSAGALLGVLLGLASMSLRGHSGGVIPGILLQLLVFGLIPPFL
jgi:hypothetical protein